MARSKKTKIERNRYELNDVSFIFSIGEEIAPTWDVMRAALKRIDTYGYQRVVPVFCDRDMLYSATKEQVSWLVPMLVRNIDKGFDQGRYNIVEDEILVVIGYILVWYWHVHLGGPRPKVQRVKGVQHGRVKWHADLRCPFCNKEYEPQSNWNWEKWSAEKRFEKWLAWLPRHAKEYHQWDI